LAESELLSFHFHHFFLGLVLCAIGRGQRVVSLFIQAVGLALFVEGLALYSAAPMFDVVRPFTERVDFQPPVWTSASFLDATTLQVSWALPSELAWTWTCSDDVANLVPEIYRALFELQEANLNSSVRTPIPRTEPLVYDVVLVEGKVPTLLKLPMYSPDQPFYAANATLCERIFGIYSQLQQIRQNKTKIEWWRS
jgi:hypothetical protein